jgi:DNA-binding XRE family transcriptional regulator
MSTERIKRKLDRIEALKLEVRVLQEEQKKRLALSDAQYVDIAAIIGQNMRNARTKAGISLVDVSSLSGVSRTSLTKIEYGKQLPKLPTILLFCAVTGCKISDVLPDSLIEGVRG